MYTPVISGLFCLLLLLSSLLSVGQSAPWNDCDPVVQRDGLNVLNCTGKDRIDLPKPLPDEVEVLDFSNNRFTELPLLPDSPSTCPDDVDCTDLGPTQHCRLHVSFSKNEIYRFHEHALHNLKCLLTLNLSFNELKEEIFTPTTFQEGAYRLQSLILRGNPLGSLPDHVLVEPFMPDLRELDLSQCQLTEIGESSVDDFLELRLLNLSHNNLKTLPSRVFKGLNKLQVLDLQHNQLTHLPELVFADLVHLRILQLSNNLVHSFHNDAFTKDSNLQILDLGNNRLEEIPYTAVDKLPKLQRLDLSYNPIVKINRGEAVNSVTTLYLDNLQYLTSVQKDALSSFPSLTTLSISRNPLLKYIEPGMLADNSSALINVYLVGNKLSTLDHTAIPHRQLKLLQLSGNPWICDDHIAWMIVAPSIKPGTARCAAPGALRDVDIKSLDPRQLQRYVSIAPITGLVAALIILPLALIGCYLIWKRRKHCMCCSSLTIKGRYVSVFTRDMDAEDEDRVTFDLRNNIERLKSVSNGEADETKPFIQMEEQRQDEKAEDNEDF